jgi:putative membrane protein
MRGIRSISRSYFSFRKLLMGAAAGFIATAPMSLSMLVGWTLLPRREKYPLPPRLITEEITERVGIEDKLTENELVGLTIFSHFGYGALFGSIYALFSGRLPVHSSLKGGLAGLAVWVGSYLGWLPAIGILRPATRHPWRRNLMMILAHLVWGVTLGEITRKLTAEDQE